MSDTPGFNQAYEQASQAFGKFVPGFDFLQGLVKNAGKSLPNVGQWVAPTLDPVELERRIDELKTVQFWLEQNARMLGATIQALEVQRMTLGALKGMNVSMTDLSEALKVKVPDMFSAAAATPSATPAAPSPAPAPAPAAADSADAAPAVDPMQWWGSLTQQFTELAAQAMQASSQAATDAASQATEAMQAATAAAEAAATAATEAAAKATADAVQAVQPQTAPKTKAAPRKTARAAAPAPAPAPAAKKAPAKRAPAKKTR